MRNVNVPGGQHYTCVNGQQLAALAQRFRAEFSGAQVHQLRESKEYWDTIDGRLVRAGLVCEWVSGTDKRGTMQLRKLGEMALQASLTVQAAPMLVHDLPVGPLRERLLPIIGIRALLPTARCTVTGQCVSRFDQAGKLLARIYFEKIKINSSSLNQHTAVSELCYVRLCPLRGYEKAAQEMASTLACYAQLQQTNQDIYCTILQLSGVNPSKSNKFGRVKLRAQMRSDDAIKRCLLALAKVMVANEAGMRAQWDTEFLHDYRVALRRTRAALVQTKKIHSADIYAQFEDTFSWLGAVTSSLRDIDVYLLALPDYQRLLPRNLRPGLESLKTLLLAEQVQAQQALCNALDSDRYRQAMLTWLNYLGDVGDAAFKHEKVGKTLASRPVKELANERIWKTYRKMIKQGSKLGKQSPDDDFHRVRNTGKQLRYLLALFRSLYSVEVKQAVTMLKGLQNYLGRFQDVCVQMDALQDWLKRLEKAEVVQAETRPALHELLRRLEAERKHLRAQFKTQFTPFSSKSTMQFFQQHFSEVTGRAVGK